MSQNQPTLYVRPTVIYLSRGLAKELNSESYTIDILERGKRFKLSPEGEVRPFPSDPNSIARRFLDADFPVGRYTGIRDGDGFVFTIETLESPKVHSQAIPTQRLPFLNQDTQIEEEFSVQTINMMLRYLTTRKNQELETVASILRYWRAEIIKDQDKS